MDSPLVQRKFVRIAHPFMRKWAGKRMHTLIINFALGYEHSSTVKSWLAKSAGSGVEEIQLHTSGRSQRTNVLERTLVFFDKARNLKRLCLRSCILCPNSWKTDRFSNLASLMLVNVPLYQRDVDCILSACTNLISLELWGCDLPRYVRIDGRLMMKLTVHGALNGMLDGIEINCPCLEVFEYEGLPISVRFVHVPVLREAKVWSILSHSEDGCSLLFDHVGKQAPHIQSLSLMIRTEFSGRILLTCSRYGMGAPINLMLVNVPLYQRDVDCILSACTNLLSLVLLGCYLPRYVRIDGRLMMKLTVYGLLNGIELNCPCLEVFEYEGLLISVRFVHVPVLREAKLWSVLLHTDDGCSLFDHVGKQAPHIQSLSLMIRTEVKLPLLSMLATSRLKELEIVVKCGFDLFSVTDLLNAFPCLETLQLVLLSNSSISIQKREYCDCSHSKLKEVKMRGFHDKWNAMELTLYLLKNATALEWMTLVKHRTHRYSREQVKFLQELRKINPSAQLIICAVDKPNPSRTFYSKMQQQLSGW